MLWPLLIAQLAASSPPVPAVVMTPVAPLKSALAPSRLPGCESTRTVDASARDSALARQALSAAQDAAMQGDRAKARTLLEEARRRDPDNWRAALELSRVLEESSQAAASLASTCDALRHPVVGADRDELQARRARLVTPARMQQATKADLLFATGLSAARVRDWRRAANAFANAAQLEPSSSAALFNQGVSLVMANEREEAASILERYLQIAPDAPERIAIARSLSTLRGRTYSAPRTLLVGLVPGMGQFTTNRPAAGALVLATVGGAALAATHPVTKTRRVPYLDPNGDLVPFDQRYTTYPYRTAGIATAAVVTLFAAIEARGYAARSHAPVRFAVVDGAPAIRIAFGSAR